MMNLIITGSIAFDHIMVFNDQFKNHILPDKIHILNVAFNVENLKKEFGGTAGNIAYNLKLLEQNPIMVATAGKDFAEYQRYFENKGLQTEHIKILEDEFTAQCFITTDQDDNQITAFHGGAMFQADLKKLENSFVTENDIVIISPNGKDAMLKHAYFCRQNNVKYIFDPGQSIPAFSEKELLDCIKGSDFVIVNDYEWQLIQDKTTLNLDNIFEYTKGLIITLGGEGSKIYSTQKEIFIDVAKADEIVDPTGCGDAYRAGLMFGLKENFDLKICGQIASTIASFAVEKHGTQNHSLNLNKLKERYTISFGEKLNIK